MLFRKFIYVILVLVVSFCFGQKKPVKRVTPKKQNKMEIPDITKNDIKVFSLKELANRENKKILAKTNDSSQIINENAKELHFKYNDFEYFYKEGKLAGMGKPIGNTAPIQGKYGKTFEQRLNTDISFYPNEQIRMIRQYSYTPQGYFPIGNWYVYDEAGNLLQHIDYEKHFKMSYYKIAQIADSYDYRVINIVRSFDDKDFSYWLIILDGIQDQNLPTKFIIVNDKTGKILHEMNEEEFNNFHDFDYISKYQEELYKLFKLD